MKTDKEKGTGTWRGLGRREGSFATYRLGNKKEGLTKVIKTKTERGEGSISKGLLEEEYKLNLFKEAWKGEGGKT